MFPLVKPAVKERSPDHGKRHASEKRTTYLNLILNMFGNHVDISVVAETPRDILSVTRSPLSFLLNYFTSCIFSIALAFYLSFITNFFLPCFYIKYFRVLVRISLAFI